LVSPVSFYYIVRWSRYKFEPVISGLMLGASLGVTAKMATPRSRDSKLTEVQLESCRGATKALEGT